MSPRRWTDADLLSLMHDVCTAVREALDASDRAGWRPLGTDGAHGGQYGHDVVADAAALMVLGAAGVGVLSEESGLAGSIESHGVVVVVDPVDGSSNAARGLPWYATSVCAVDSSGPRVAMVVNQATGETFWGVRGGGAFTGPLGDGRPLVARGATRWRDSVVLVSGAPRGWMGWRQFRCLGACALDLCVVAAGRADAYLDLTPVGAHGVWDYLGGLLILREAGGDIVDAEGRELVVLEAEARRSPVAAGAGLLDEALAARRKIA
jgi:fructose-1,6-bisphosphatase/inositol monophosphatase family enzyme